MSKQKKNLLTLLILFALLAVVLALYFFVPRGGNSGTEENSDAGETITVDTIDTGSIVRLRVKNGDKELALEKKGKEWRFGDRGDIPLDEEAVSGLLSAFETVKATGSLSYDPDRLSEYGLDKPSMSITVETSDGREYAYSLGAGVPVKGGYYGIASKPDKIYFLEQSLYDKMDINYKSLIKKDDLPEIEEDYMTYLHVDNQKGEDFEAKTVSEKEQVASYSSWNITKPYEKPLGTSIKDWKTTLGYFSALTFDELVEYGSKNPAKYGLDKPSAAITVRYYSAKDGYKPEEDSQGDAQDDASGEKDAGTENSEDSASSDSAPEIPEQYRQYKTVHLLVGNKKGEEYYVCLKGSRNVYTMSQAVVENMTKLDAYTAMDHSVYATLATDIKGYEVRCGKTKLKVTRTPVEDTEQNDSGTDTTMKNKEQNIWKLNGKQISAEDEQDFLTPYSSAYLLEFTSKAKSSVRPADKKPVLTIVYHEEKRDVTVKYLPYDGTNFYRVDKDGMDYFLVDKRSVDDVIAKFRGIEKLGEK